MNKTAKPRRWNRLIENPPAKGELIILWFLDDSPDSCYERLEVVIRDYDGHYRDQCGVYYIPSKDMRWIPFKRPYCK